MNYIKQLQQDNEILRGALNKTAKELTEFIVFLNTDKFIGLQSDGSRKDWISTGDVILRLQEIRNLTHPF